VPDYTPASLSEIERRQEVALPQQQIVVEVRDKQPVMQRRASVVRLRVRGVRELLDHRRADRAAALQKACRCQSDKS
jgi:hypothetical protein